MEERQFIDKPYVIVVEGKLDKIILKIVLDYIKEKFPNLEEKVSNTQVFNIKGKNNLNSPGVKHSIRIAKGVVKALLVILDKNDSYDSTEQMIQTFLKNENFDWIALKDYLIVPPSNLCGKELEDYLVYILKQLVPQRIQVLRDCIRKVSTGRKFGKKLFFSYLLINDNCNYDGLSISEGMLKSCLEVETLDLIVEKVKQFLQNAPS
ncbi:hypothetical protein [Aquifex sp.]